MNFVLGSGVLVTLIVLGVPIGFALGLAGIGSLLLLVPPSMIPALMSKVFHGTTDNFVLVTIPMFILMAEFLGSGGVAQDLLTACNRAMRRVRGGMAMACVMSGAVLASASGSSTASAASIARTAFPVMRKAGYAPSFAVGVISISGTLAIMIPPSVAFVLYGVMTETSIGQLFLAGIIPGILTGLGYIVTIMLMLKWKPHLGSKPELEAKLANESGKGRIWPIGILIALVLGGLYSGVATPSEIAALGALGALLISILAGRMGRNDFVSSIANTLQTTAMIILIIISAHLFGYFISFSKVTDAMLAWIADSGVSPVWVMIIVVALYILMGMIMDQAAIIILTAPITAPLMMGLGFDPVWWGVVMIKTAEIGLVSPPMGLNVFVTSGTARVNLKDSFIGVMPFLAAEFVILALLLAFPAISLALT